MIVLTLVVFLHLSWCQLEPRAGMKASLLKKKVPQGTILASPDTPGHFYQYLQTTNIYVDKTLLVKTIIEDIPEPIVVITGPEQWGKSLNLLLLSFFWEAELSEAGAMIPQSQTQAYKFFMLGATFDKAPLLSQHTKIVDQHLAKYPVLLLDFDQVQADGFDTFYDTFKMWVCSSIMLYCNTIENLLENKINVRGIRIPEDNAIWQKFRSVETLCGNTAERDLVTLQNSLLIFSELLAFLYETKVVILVDNYDAFLRKLYEGYDDPVSPSQISQIEDFFQTFLRKTFTNNTHLHKSVFTGILPLSLDFGVTSTDVVYRSVTHTQLHPHYGFSSDELDLILKHAEIPENLTNRVYAVYDGYEVDDFATTIYNPWAIVTFLQDRDVNYYWAPINNPLDFAFKVFKNSRNRGTIKGLRGYDCLLVNRSLLGPQSLPLTQQLKTLRTTHQDMNRNREQLFYWYLTATGYLTVDSRDHRLCARIPNFEVRAFAHYALYGVHLVYARQPEAAAALIEVLEHDNNTRAVDALAAEFKNMIKDDHHAPVDEFHLKFFDVLQTAAKIDPKYDVTNDLPLETRKDPYFEPNMLISNNGTTVIVEIRKNRNYDDLKDDVSRLWLYCGAYFKAFPKTRLLKLIVMNTGKNGLVKYVHFSYPRIDDIPRYDLITQFELELRSSP